MRILLRKLKVSYEKLKIKAYYLDVLFLMFILYLLSETLVVFSGDMDFKTTTQMFLKFIWLSSPVLFLYLLLRVLLLPVFLCAYVLVVMIVIMTFVNSTKMALTGEPLSYNDITVGFNLSVAGRYISLTSVFGVVIIVTGAVVAILLSKKTTTTIKNYIALLFLIVVIFPFSFSPYIGVIFGVNSKLAEKINVLSMAFDVNYKQWNWRDNATANGLPMHLIQTSVRRSIPGATVEERIQYLNEKKQYASADIKNKTIIYILCESCWYDKKNFRENFKPLIDNGYAEFRATSPVYGGGTANVEFEMLTGLSSDSDKLSGIIYQEYSSAFKDNADSLASALKIKGYGTFAAHNFHKNFWRRDEVYKKFGFDMFSGLSDMGEAPSEFVSIKKSWQWQPDDYLLYNSALKYIQNAEGGNKFLHLISMSTHGPFKHINDYGEGVYNYETHEAVERLVKFSEQVEKIEPDAVIVIYGDHKPALNKYFVENGVLSREIFSKIGEEKDEDFIFKSNVTPLDFGDVPVLIKSSDKKAVQELIGAANQKPFFCVSALVDKYFIQSGLVSFNYNVEHGCENKEYLDYAKLKNMTPPWIYSMALFHD